MKEKRSPEGNFERRLLGELKSVVAERGADQEGAGDAPARPPAWRHAPRLALVAVAALGVAAGILVFSSGGDNPPKAFAVEPQQGGGVTIKIYSLEDAAGLERALQRAGIPAQVTWLPPGVSCREPHFTPSRAKSALGGSVGGMTMGGPAPAMTIGIMSAGQYRRHWREYRRGEISAAEFRESTPNISLDPASFRRNQSVVISGSPTPYDGDPKGGYEAHFAIAEGPVEPCEPGRGLVHPTGAPALAKASDAPAPAPPGHGEFLYAKTRVVQLQSWEPDGPGTGSRDKPRHFTARMPGPGLLPALVTTVKETWTPPGGKVRVRETLGGVEFLSGADQRRWEAAGSPPPFEYDPAEHHLGRDGSGRPTKEYTRTWRGSHTFANVTELAEAPTEPEALRLSIERRRGGGQVTVSRLMDILGEPIVSAALRAAAFNALAEIPGVELEGHAVDALGRHGVAVSWGSEGKHSAYCRQFIVDPRTSRLLAQAETIANPKAAKVPGLPADTVFRETAYLGSGIVDSTHERATGTVHNPVAKASSDRSG